MTIKNIIISGTCVCPGEVEGEVNFYKKGKKYTKKDVVVLNEWVTSGVSLLKNAGGILSKNGGLTCHASIIAREFNIPCMVSVKNIDLLGEGDRIFLDAAAEEIRLLSR